VADGEYKTLQQAILRGLHLVVAEIERGRR